MKYFISSLGFWSKNVTSILNKNILLFKKKKKEVQVKKWKIADISPKSFLIDL
jgi:hypothetical protein